MIAMVLRNRNALHTYIHTAVSVLCSAILFSRPNSPHNLLSFYSLNVKITTYKIKMLSTDVYRMNTDRVFDNRVPELFWCISRVKKLTLYIHVTVGAFGTQKLEIHTTFGHLFMFWCYQTTSTTWIWGRS
jgi:hypothetical protein